MYGAAPQNKVSAVKRAPPRGKSIYDGETDAAHLGKLDEGVNTHMCLHQRTTKWLEAVLDLI